MFQLHQEQDPFWTENLILQVVVKKTLVDNVYQGHFDWTQKTKTFSFQIS